MTDRRDPDVHRLVMDWPDDAVAEIEALRHDLARAMENHSADLARLAEAEARIAELEETCRKYALAALMRESESLGLYGSKP